MKAGMLTSISETCGIADYSRHLAEGLSKVVELDLVSIRHSTQPWGGYIAESSKRLNACDVIHIQHEYSFWGTLPGRDGIFDTYFTQMSALDKPRVLTAHTLDTLPQLLRIDKGFKPTPKTIAKRLLAKIPGYRRAVEIGVFDIADRIIIHDQPAADRLAERGISPDKIRIVPMGVPAPDPTPDAGSAFCESRGLKDKKLIVIFGFLRAGRGYEAMLDVLPKLNDNVSLVIAGGPQNEIHKAYMSALISEIEARGLKDRVVITGYISDLEVAGAMRAADVVLCSQESGTGSYSIQVALGYGRPIVASDLPCFTYLEETSDCLVTYKRSDSEDLDNKLKSVLQDESLAQKMSAKALSYADKYTWDKVAVETKRVYDELLSG